MPRPSLYTPELVELICEQLALGVPLTQICAREDVPVAPRTVRDWEADMPEVSAAIARAREHGEYALAEECLEIADDGRNDWMEKTLKGGETIEVINAEAIQRSKLRVDTRLKLLAKFNPKRWGERLALEHEVVDHARDLEEALERAKRLRGLGEDEGAAGA